MNQNTTEVQPFPQSWSFRSINTLEDQHGTKRSPNWKEKPSSKPSFSGSMLIFQGEKFSHVATSRQSWSLGNLKIATLSHRRVGRETKPSEPLVQPEWRVIGMPRLTTSLIRMFKQQFPMLRFGSIRLKPPLRNESFRFQAGMNPLTTVMGGTLLCGLFNTNLPARLVYGGNIKLETKLWAVGYSFAWVLIQRCFRFLRKDLPTLKLT